MALQVAQNVEQDQIRAGGNQRRIPNEDSLGFELHDVDLFKPDRLAGYDVHSMIVYP